MIEQELEQQRLEHEANLYCFTALLDELDPQTLFCGRSYVGASLLPDGSLLTLIVIMAAV